MKINLPCEFVAEDYHELSYLEDCYQIIIPEIKVIELGSSDGLYYGMVYVGSLKDKANKKLSKQIKESLLDI